MQIKMSLRVHVTNSEWLSPRKQARAGGVCLPGKLEALSSNPSAPKITNYIHTHIHTCITERKQPTLVRMQGKEPLHTVGGDVN
jgi:hypothetical protein